MSHRVDATERAFRPDVTVAVVLPREGRVLLVEERVRGQLVLNQPAGHLEPGETLIEAARRETLEESGWDVMPTHLIGFYRWASPDGSVYVRVAFAAEARGFDPDRPLDEGIERTLWMSPAELHARQDRLRSPLVLATVEDWLGGRRLPLDTLREIA